MLDSPRADAKIPLNQLDIEEVDAKFEWDRPRRYGSLGNESLNDSRQNIAGFLKHEYRERIRSPLDAGITAVLFISLLVALFVGVVRPLLRDDSSLNKPLSQMF
uniref:Uncharacterized protein n=1 Tax=Lotharella oceanica TaxID=641309 RepID=A0A7S2XDA6_9EUKA|mmetsp:Transcript_25544/g.47635  ORF Transcript_25544/g.47635 Transcript_25544/m.47635 type:complete len:104 (+) Transcript_25544:82-393(+)